MNESQQYYHLYNTMIMTEQIREENEDEYNKGEEQYSQMGLELSKPQLTEQVNEDYQITPSSKSSF